MPSKRPAASAEAARLKVLAVGDESAFVAHAVTLLESPKRLDREAALDALAERPTPAVRQRARALYFELDANPMKLDQGAAQRINIVRILRTIGDLRDVDVAVRASETRETAFGEDITWSLRVHGLRMLAELSPDVFPFYAVEHLDDIDASGDRREPAITAFQLLDATANHVPLYQWLIGAGSAQDYLPVVLELFTAAPPALVQRAIDRVADSAVATGDERLCIALGEAVVKLELEASYGLFERMMTAKISDELYNYIAVLMVSTNRAPLLAILERQLHRGRRPRIVEEALRVRTTPEQAVILKRWEDGEELA